MIMRGTTPKTLGWRGCLAVLGMGALMLPLLPAWARAQAAPPAAEKPPSATPSAAAPAGGDQDNARAALNAAEAELQQKQAEVAALTAKVQLLRARLKADQVASPSPWRDVLGRIDGGRVIVEINPTDNATAVQDLVKKLQANRPAEDVVVIDAKSGKIIMKMKGAGAQNATTDKDHLIMAPIGAPGGADGTASPPPGAGPDKRIDELEMKLKAILDEVEKLRRERKEAAPEWGAGAPAPGAPVVIDKIPYLKWVLTNTAPAAQAAQERVKALAAQVEAREARYDAMSRECQDLRARMTQVEKTRDADAAQANARIAKAEDLINKAEAELAKAKVKDPKGEEARAIAAELEVYQAQLQKAKEAREMQGGDIQSVLKDLQRQLDDRSAECEKDQAILKQLQQEIVRAKSTPAGGSSTPESRSAPKDGDEASAALRSADAAFDAGDYKKALKLYSEVAESHPKEEAGVNALSGCVRCLMAQGRNKEVSQVLSEIRGRLNVVPSEARQRWEAWLEAASKTTP